MTWPIDWCPGKKQDDDGTWYCPRDPENDEFDCDECQLDRMRFYELVGDIQRDEDSWG